MEQQMDMEQIAAEWKARMEIENLMGRYAALLTAGRCQDILEKLWTKEPDRTLEEGSLGVYGDARLPLFGMDTFYNQRYGMPLNGREQPDNRGRMTTLLLNSPVIDIYLNEGKAFGSYMAMGTETRVWRNGEESGIPYVDAHAKKEDRHMAFWFMQRYHVQFRCEHGSWRIVHMHIWDIFRTPYNMDWVEYAGIRHLDDEMMDAQMRFGDCPTHALYPTTKHWQYGPTELPPAWDDILKEENKDL